ncbi:chaplin family protein [Actinomadura syzygii]|uniref:Chaplin n=1 Tax=Actinomadura syzygii TaxID=1427538 RepID=A0A5D0UAB2_9ACTN|nr:chaplin [Actinomadura syzygii]TYC14676.1 chaplin [Actinomadura syzygii]
MRTWAKSTSRAAVVAAGVVVLGVSALPANAFADTTDGTGSVLGGNQVNAPISAPVDVSGNGVAVLGKSIAGSGGGAKVRQNGGGGGAGQQTAGTFGVGSGNQVNAPVAAPVNVCGNGVAVIGIAVAGCQGGSTVKGGGGAGGGQKTDGTGGVASGNQVNAPVSVPVDVCGNAAAVVGVAGAGCQGGSTVKGGGAGSGQSTSGVFGVGSGNQVDAPISVPADVCGNAVGNAVAACQGGSSTSGGTGGSGGSGGQTTDGTFGVLSGNQGNTPVNAPAEVCGNAAAIVGQAVALCKGGTHVHGGHGGDQHTSGVGGVGSGNQGGAPTTAPADVCGNAAAVVGVAAPLCADDPYQDPYDNPYRRTSGALDGSLQNAALINAVSLVGTQSPEGATGLLPKNGALPANGVLPKKDALAQAVGGLSKAGEGKQARLAGGTPGASGLPKPGAVIVNGILPRGLSNVGGTGARQATGGVSTTSGLPKLDTLAKNGGLNQAGLPKGHVQDGAQPKGTNPGALLSATRHVPGAPSAETLPATSVVPGTTEIGPIKKVATVRPAKERHGSSWTVAAAGMVSFVAGALMLVRRAPAHRSASAHR